MLEEIIYSKLNKQDKDTLKFCLVEAGAFYGVAEKDVIMFGRCTLNEACARQLAIYIACKSFGLTVTQAGKLLLRDRVTIEHALHHIELRRTDPALNDAIIEIEARIDAAQKEAV